MKGLPASKKSPKDLKAPCDTKTDKDSTARCVRILFFAILAAHNVPGDTKQTKKYRKERGTPRTQPSGWQINEI